MFNNKKCPSCNEKVDKKFRYCPWCGSSFRSTEEKENFGMLGKDDFIQDIQKEMQKGMALPGLNKVMSSLVKQLENEMQKQHSTNPGVMPKGFSIQISTGLPNMDQMQQNKPKIKKEIIQAKISDKEKERRGKLEKKEAESSIRRLPDKVVYEIKCPGAKSKDEVVIAPLENGVEIKIYTKDFCYVKSIPMKIDILGFNVKDGKMFLDLKG